jgi:GxxExxY protein
LESIYEECLSYELKAANISYERQKEIPIQYKGIKLGCGYRIDLLIEGGIIVEIKSCDTILPIHEAQLLTYLKLMGLKIGLLINLNVPVLREGIKRIAN